jgi:hypothetical protein
MQSGAGARMWCRAKVNPDEYRVFQAAAAKEGPLFRSLRNGSVKKSKTMVYAEGGSATVKPPAMSRRPKKRKQLVLTDDEIRAAWPGGPALSKITMVSRWIWSGPRMATAAICSYRAGPAGNGAVAEAGRFVQAAIISGKKARFCLQGLAVGDAIAFRKGHGACMTMRRIDHV